MLGVADGSGRHGRLVSTTSFSEKASHWSLHLAAEKRLFVPSAGASEIFFATITTQNSSLRTSGATPEISHHFQRHDRS